MCIARFVKSICCETCENNHIANIRFPFLQESLIFYPMNYCKTNSKPAPYYISHSENFPESIFMVPTLNSLN